MSTVTPSPSSMGQQTRSSRATPARSPWGTVSRASRSIRWRIASSCRTIATERSPSWTSRPTRSARRSPSAQSPISRPSTPRGIACTSRMRGATRSRCSTRTPTLSSGRRSASALCPSGSRSTRRWTTSTWRTKATIRCRSSTRARGRSARRWRQMRPRRESPTTRITTASTLLTRAVTPCKCSRNPSLHRPHRRARARQSRRV